MKHIHNKTDKLILKKGEGRVYNCGTMTAVFKADENETATKYSILESSLNPTRTDLVHINTKKMTKFFTALKAQHQYLLATNGWKLAKVIF